MKKIIDFLLDHPEECKIFSYTIVTIVLVMIAVVSISWSIANFAELLELVYTNVKTNVEIPNK